MCAPLGPTSLLVFFGRRGSQGALRRVKGIHSPDSIEKMNALHVGSDKLVLFLVKENLLNRS